jgi:hypothetical protein
MDLYRDRESALMTGPWLTGAYRLEVNVWPVRGGVPLIRLAHAQAIHAASRRSCR